MPSTKDVFWLLWKAVLFWFAAIWPISKFTCLCIWASSMCWFSGSKCLHRICHKVILAAIYATESFKARHLLSFPASCFFFFFIVNVWAFCSIVYDNEFSARLSVRSIMRLRAAAIMALSQDTTADATMVFRLARRFLCANKCVLRGVDVNHRPEDHQVFGGT